MLLDKRVGHFFIGSGVKIFEVTTLASGKNQIVSVHFSNGAQWLLNAGRSFPSDQGEWLIAPFLRSRGTQRLEGILLSDLSKQNTGGLASVLRDFPARHLLYPASVSSGPDEFFKVLLKLGRKAKAFHRGDEVWMGTEKIRIIARSQRGAAILMESGPWRILLISRWEPALFRELVCGYENSGEVHAVFLPAFGQEIPSEFKVWLEQVRPLLAVLPDLEQELISYFASVHIPCLALRHTGALRFMNKGSRLELASFLNGPVGVYSYS